MARSTKSKPVRKQTKKSAKRPVKKARRLVPHPAAPEQPAPEPTDFGRAGDEAGHEIAAIHIEPPDDDDDDFRRHRG